MADEISLIREYEAIIRTMKEQISVLKTKLNTVKTENRSFSAENLSFCDKSQLSMLSQKAQEAESLAAELRSANDLVRKLHTEKRGLEQRLETSQSRQSFVLGESALETQIQRLQDSIQSLLQENTELKQRLEAAASHVRYEDLNTTQKARYMIMERKVRIIETENKVLKEKIASSELERRQLSDKVSAMHVQVQDLEQMKVKLKRLNEDLKAKDALIAGMTEKVQVATRRKMDVDLTKEHLDDYKAQISTRSPKASLSPTHSIRSSHVPTDRTDQKLKEIAFELKKTQDEVAQLRKAGNAQWGEQSGRTGSPSNSSYELNSFEDSRTLHTERAQAKPADLPRSPPHTEVKYSPVSRSTEERPLLSQLQLVRNMKKPGVSLFRPTAARKPVQEVMGHKPSSRMKIGVH